MQTYTVVLIGGGCCWDEHVTAASHFAARVLAEERYCKSITGAVAVHCERENSTESAPYKAKKSGGYVARQKKNRTPDPAIDTLALGRFASRKAIQE